LDDKQAAAFHSCWSAIVAAVSLGFATEFFIKILSPPVHAESLFGQSHPGFLLGQPHIGLQSLQATSLDDEFIQGSAKT